MHVTLGLSPGSVQLLQNDAPEQCIKLLAMFYANLQCLLRSFVMSNSLS